MAKIFNVFLFLLLFSRLGISQEQNQITYIANEGVFIEYEGTKVYIDVLHQKYKHSLYQFTRTPYRLKLIAGEGPFEEVDLMLVTHLHGDHIHIGDTKELLANNPKTILMTSQQVLDSIGLVGYQTNQLYAIQPEDRGLTFQMQGLDIQTFPLIHSYKQRNHAIVNTAYLLDFEGLTILHVGDPELTEENLKRINKAVGKGVDYALLPDWFFAEGDYLSKLKKNIKAKKYIAMHVITTKDGLYERKLKRRVKDLGIDLNVFLRVGETEPLKK